LPLLNPSEKNNLPNLVNNLTFCQIIAQLINIYRR